MSEPVPKKAPPEPEEEEDEEASEPIDFDKIEAEDDPLAQKRVAAVAIPGVDGEPSDEGPEGNATGSKIVPITDRPLTLGKGRIELHGGLRVGAITFPGTAATAAVTNTSQALMLGGTYGVNDQAEIGADYALSVNPGSIKGPLTLRGAYQLKAGKLDFAVAGGLAVDFFEQTNTITNMTTSTTFASLQLGAWVRYHATPSLTIFTGQPALPSSSVPLSKLALPLPPFQYQVQVGLNNQGTTAVEVPLGLSFQATPAIYAFTAFNFAHIRLANTQTGLIFSDFIPFVLGGFYSLSKIDVGFIFSDDLKQGTDYLRFDAVLRYGLK
jgi:hypothetical protein